MNALKKWVSNEGHRGYLYRIGLAAVALCIVLGLLTDEVAAKIILLIAAVLGLGGNGLATVNTAVGTKLLERRADELLRLQAAIDAEKRAAEEKGFRLGRRARPAEAERVAYRAPGERIETPTLGDPDASVDVPPAG